MFKNPIFNKIKRCIFFVCIAFLPALVLPQKITLYGGKILGFWSKFCLEIFLSTKIVIIPDWTIDAVVKPDVAGPINAIGAMKQPDNATPIAVIKSNLLIIESPQLLF